MLGLELTDPGFDERILSEFRARLMAGTHEQVLFDKVLAHLRTQGLLKARETALRWMVRGLAAQLAIRKVQVDQEFQANRRPGRAP